MTAAAFRTAVALATLLAAATCDSDVPQPAPVLTEGSPPLAVIPPPAPRPTFRVAPDAVQTLGRSGTLAPFFAALEAIENGRAAAPVVAIQLGDSHSAGDLFSGRLRELFQQRFGAGGRGMLPPGIPYPYFRPALVTVADEGSWRPASSFQAAGPFGIAGVIQQSAAPDARMTLTETEPAGFDRAFFEVLRQPGGGALRLQVDDEKTHDFPTGAAAAGPHWIEFETPAHSHRLTLTAIGGGGATVLAWGTQRAGPGVIYENFGISGAAVGVTAHWDPATVAAELQRRNPALLVVAYGSNEGVAPPAALTRYAEHFAARIKPLSAAAPGAAVIVVGPPDLDRRGQPAATGCDGEWAPPPTLATVKAAQQAVAQREQWYFWDWQAAMGGPCAADRWARQTPPLAFPDHVHQKAEGYRLSAEMLFAELMNEYRRYRARLGGPGLGS